MADAKNRGKNCKKITVFKGLLSPWLRKTRMQKVIPYINGKVLDYGCGNNPSLIEMGICNSDNYLGVDINEKLIKKAQELYPAFRFELSIPDETINFDTIVLLAVIEHISDPLTLLKKIKVKLHPKGRIVITTPHPSFEWTHTTGAKFGLFSPVAVEEHEQLVGYKLLQAHAKKADLYIETYQRFLFWANQLFVLRSK